MDCNVLCYKGVDWLVSIMQWQFINIAPTVTVHVFLKLIFFDKSILYIEICEENTIIHVICFPPGEVIHVILCG